MDNAARARRRVLALFLPVAAVLYISAEAVSPKGADKVAGDTASALRLLAIAGRHPAQVYAAGAFAVLGLGALAVSYAAIATLVTGRGSAIATVAALIGGIGAFCGAIVNVLVFPDLAAAATAHLTPAAAAAFLVEISSSGFAYGLTAAYFIGIFVGPALMGFALWRSRAVPRWLAVLFFVGLEVAQQQISSGPIVILYMLPFAIAMVLLAVRIWPPAGLPMPQPKPKPTGVPG
jgi:hypothetical protein